MVAEVVGDRDGGQPGGGGDCVGGEVGGLAAIG
jgi:hypothetical protein